MKTIEELGAEVNDARQRYLLVVRQFTPRQAEFKPDEATWSVVENTEHIARAEHSGVAGMWRAIEGVESGAPLWQGAAVHHGKAIEQIVAETWKEKEQVPAIAAPTWGGSLAFWTSMLEANEHVLSALLARMRGHDIDAIHYPHPISGPLSMRQRLEFLRFHLDRHRMQVAALQRSGQFPVHELTESAGVG